MPPTDDPRPSEPPHQPPSENPNYQPDPWFTPEGLQERQRLAQEKARQTKVQRVTVLGKFMQGVTYAVAALEVLLGLRFMLRLTAANPDNTFAGIIYGLSQPFVNPFSTLFISPTFNGSLNIIDVNVLVAMAAYLALLTLFLGLLRILFEN
ncbi:MAG: YggT family protein [Cyanobacteria bacterium]|nr:YggT family protein [Cyanobacteriota bacterium]MDA0865100.1 YggT family protein [Cyanobacteriota bacterium]